MLKRFFINEVYYSRNWDRFFYFNLTLHKKETSALLVAINYEKHNSVGTIEETVLLNLILRDIT